MLINSPLNNETFSNPDPAYPSLDLLELFAVVRINKATGAEVIASKVIEAMDTINRQLRDYQFNNASVINLPLDADRSRFYKRAVAYEAAALIGEDNLDYDTSSNGQIREESGLAKAQSLRRRVEHAIADMISKPRNRVRLI